MNETKGRLFSGAGFGFFHTMLMAFSIIVPAFYFSSLDITIVTYAFLLTEHHVFVTEPSNIERNFLNIGIWLSRISKWTGFKGNPI